MIRRSHWLSALPVVAVIVIEIVMALILGTLAAINRDGPVDRVVAGLASLGVSHLHLSPVLEAVPGSAHGYEVVDHARVREELGGEAGLRSLSRTARAQQ